MSCQWALALGNSTLTCLYLLFLPLITLLLDPSQSLHSGSNTNAKKWETELQTLRENNARLVDALQESSANVESWKKQLGACKEESDTLRKKVIQSCTPAGSNVHKPVNRAILPPSLKRTQITAPQTVESSHACLLL